MSTEADRELIVQVVTSAIQPLLLRLIALESFLSANCIRWDAHGNPLPSCSSIERIAETLAIERPTEDADRPTDAS
ncbi:MAG: hypothetical protein GTO14_23220 [Anaerolineales bacterium]|nr:hypothetical protein [Anaerolineales bacterium]